MSPQRCQELLTAIYTEVHIMRKDYMKIVYVLIGVIAANLGVEFLGTPWHTHMMGYFVWIAGIFLLLSTFAWWNRLGALQVLIRLLFSSMLLYSITIRTFLYEVGEVPPPSYLGVGVNFHYIAISIVLVIIAWRKNGKNGGRE